MGREKGTEKHVAEAEDATFANHVSNAACRAELEVCEKQTSREGGERDRGAERPGLEAEGGRAGAVLTPCYVVCGASQEGRSVALRVGRVSRRLRAELQPARWVPKYTSAHTAPFAPPPPPAVRAPQVQAVMQKAGRPLDEYFDTVMSRNEYDVLRAKHRQASA